MVFEAERLRLDAEVSSDALELGDPNLLAEYVAV